MKALYLFITTIFILFAVSSCRNKSYFDESVETMNKGEISLYADDVYQVIVNELVKSYENVYPEAHIHITYESEKNVIDAMMTGKTKMVITGKQLSEAEQQNISKVNDLDPKISIIAHEAVAIITSIDSEDSIFDFDAFLTRKNNPATENSVSPKYVFVKGQTSFINAVTKGEAMNFSDMFSLGSSDSLIEYIHATKNSYGFISFALLSDEDDPKVREILSKVKILSVRVKDSAGAANVYELSQSSIAADEYPLQRNIYIIKGNMSQSLGTGFVNFMYRSKASRIFLKSGLIPQVMPGREIQIVD